MAKVDVLNARGKKAGLVELPEEIFGVQVNVPVMHRWWAQPPLPGPAPTRPRPGPRSAGARKPGARRGPAGPARARSGPAVARRRRLLFGPTPRDHSLRVNKKEKLLALRSALTDRRAGGNLVVLDGLDFEEPKTARAVELLDVIGLVGASCCSWSTASRRPRSRASATCRPCT